jgi:2,4-dienoyl-CoA reductase-like NADH-dependent reductase (Old Yellow Enzyme family)
VITNEQVKWIVRKSGIPLSRFAARLGVEPSKVIRWESGQEVPLPEIEAKLRKLETDFAMTTGAFAPFRIRQMRLKNRLVFPAMITRYADNTGIPSRRTSTHYFTIAIGGVGLLTLEATSVNENRRLPGGLGIWHPAQVQALSSLIGLIHGAGATVSIQLADAIRLTGKSPADLTEEEILQIIDDFVSGVVNAHDAGADAAELHAAHSYTLADFLSRAANKRTDHFGGNARARARIVTEILKRSREKVKESLVIGIRLNGEDFVAGGNTLKDTVELARCFEQAGSDFIHVSAGARREEGENSYSMVRAEPPAEFPDACNMYLAERIKDSVEIPVIGCGKIPNTKVAESQLTERRADLIAIGRAILADPSLPIKEKTGKFDEVIRCTYCNHCLKCIRSNQPAECPLWNKQNTPK